MSVNDPLHDPANGAEPPHPDAPEVQAAFDRVQFRTQHVDPIVRDCNRHLVDLLGPCPNTATGNWVSVDDDGNATVAVNDVVDVARLGAAFVELARRVDLAETGTKVQSTASLRRYLEDLALGRIAPAEGTSLHLGARRNNRNLKKGL
ncbi:MAG: hypothetical protein RLZZ305_1855 [Actinomycetota bacterium]